MADLYPNKMHCCDGCKYFDPESICDRRPLLGSDSDSCYEPEERTTSFTKEMLNSEDSGLHTWF